MPACSLTQKSARQQRNYWKTLFFEQIDYCAGCQNNNGRHGSRRRAAGGETRRIIREAEAEAKQIISRANKEAKGILDDAMRQVSSLGLANSVTNPEKESGDDSSDSGVEEALERKTSAQQILMAMATMGTLRIAIVASTGRMMKVISCHQRTLLQALLGMHVVCMAVCMSAVVALPLGPQRQQTAI